MSNKFESAYKIIRTLIFLVPAATVVAGMYLVLFPVETFRYSPSEPDVSKFEISKNTEKNTLSFGVFPQRSSHFIDLSLNFDSASLKPCPDEATKISIEKTYMAFLFPEEEVVTEEKRLRELLFRENKTIYPNGSLLHLKPTNEVYLLTDGKKTLFPGPEIFRAFGYSFENLVDVEKSTIDQFPDADRRVFLWTQPHPNGTIFQSFPSHNLYLIIDGKKLRIDSADILKKVWPEFYAVAVNDPAPESKLICQTSGRIFAKGKIFCRFDAQQISNSLGRYFQFTMEVPPICRIENMKIKNVKISFISEKSYATVKDSLRNIFASVVSRYMNNQNQ